ncbi:zf-HC2 domain-containing protein [Mycolicibacterium confluentis]|uniref:zf-HC2 domain-containing protein n=1 Tax=Mycolicibacterium confluentis TaxID=28047 RepID=UPI0013D0C6F7|nr:zf-HC2 domain-containing protein [Mycolicibacterium confluentis]MCV7319913.1 zf-HC2 domain-containing protein [Mycolicibacterium confluentis]
MECQVAREALSARIDGEREPVPSLRVDEHLRSCPDCRAWFDQAQQMNSLVGSLLDSEPARRLQEQAAVPTPPSRYRRALRWALGIAGAVQLALALGQAFGLDFGMLSTTHHGTAHAAHLLNESTAWSAATGAVAIAAAVRPRLAPGLACVLSVYVALLTYYVIIDDAIGQVTVARIVSHLPVALAAVFALLVWRQPEVRDTPPGAAAEGGHLKLLRSDDPAA